MQGLLYNILSAGDLPLNTNMNMFVCATLTDILG